MYVEALAETKNTTADSGARYWYETNRGNAFEYDTLVNKPNMQITVIDDSGTYDNTPTTRRNVINKAIENAKNVGWENENGGAVVHVDDIDKDIIMARHGIAHGFDRRIKLLAPITLDAGKILKNSIKINELTPKKENVAGDYVTIGAAKNEKGDLYIVRFVIDKYTNDLTDMNVLYALNAKKESGALNEPAITDEPLRITDSSISIAKLLDYVNKYFPDILPESGKSI